MTPKRISASGSGAYQVARWAEETQEPNGAQSLRNEYFVVELQGFGPISDGLSEGVARAEVEDRNKDFLLGVQNNGSSRLADEYRKKLDPERLRAFNQALREAAAHLTHADDDMSEPSLGDLEGDEEPPKHPRLRRRRPGSPTIS
ncbi:hypothetical protein [Dyella sp. ASV21]|uniref:hypothetical protein n=1 Tax=Dyella sp. ASV21 TaxID=2795114 RepID=UPI0018EC8067|nr:hypothetical protein [Dyella sp. ASV21]